MSKKKKMTPKEKLSLIPFAPADHLIYKAGVLIGEKRPSTSVGSMETHCQQVVDRLLERAKMERAQKQSTTKTK